MAKKSFVQEYESVASLLVLELLALVAFGLGGVNVVFQYAGFIVALAATFFAFRNYSKEDLKPILYVAVPLFLMSIFTSFGKFFESYDIVANLGAFLAIISFLAVGLSARRMQSFSIKNALLCIGAGLALLTLASTIITWAQYGLFYPLIHKEAAYYYYNGNLYSILNEMSWIMGFKVVEVSIDYGGLFALLCCAFLPALLFLDIKKDKLIFVLFAVIGGVGLISIISIPNLFALIFAVIMFGVALFYKYLRDNKLAINIVRYAILVIFGFAIVIFFVMVLNNSVEGFHSFIEGNSVLNRLFNSNRYMSVINPILEASLKSFNLFGINTLRYIDGYKIPDKVILTNTGIFEIEILKEGGIIAFILFLVFVLFAYESFSRYLAKSKDDNYVKVILLTFVVGFILYSTFKNDVFPITHSSTSYYPFTRSLPFFLMLFIVGFTILPSGKDEIEFVRSEAPAKEETKKVVKQDDYDFSDVEEEEII